MRRSEKKEWGEALVSRTMWERRSDAFNGYINTLQP
jgi:hypothetical protein